MKKVEEEGNLRGLMMSHLGFLDKSIESVKADVASKADVVQHSVKLSPLSLTAHPEHFN